MEVARTCTQSAWKKLYQDALFELDPTGFLAKLQAPQKAIDERLYDVLCSGAVRPTGTDGTRTGRAHRSVPGKARAINLDYGRWMCLPWAWVRVTSLGPSLFDRMWVKRNHFPAVRRSSHDFCGPQTLDEGFSTRHCRTRGDAGGHSDTCSGIVLLAVLALLFGCGGGAQPSNDRDITGNWHFSTTSTLRGMPSSTIVGSITQSGSSVSGAAHVDGSNCFDRLTTIGLIGTLSGSNVSLSSASVEGQVITLSGSISNDAFAGTYAINGGCAKGDHGNATGSRISSIDGDWRVIFKTNDQQLIGKATLSQDTASSGGSFGVSGIAVNNNLPSCFSGTIRPGTFPSSSFILGRFVTLEIEADESTVVFLGTVDPDGEISGNFAVSGGTCDGDFGVGCFGRDFQSSCQLHDKRADEI